jgi:hypothetical protein
MDQLAGLIAICGDGTVDDGEECDDGGETSSCAADCTTVVVGAICGDGTVDDGEVCDGGGLEGGSCAADCLSELVKEAAELEPECDLVNGTNTLSPPPTLEVFKTYTYQCLEGYKWPELKQATNMLCTCEFTYPCNGCSPRVSSCKLIGDNPFMSYPPVCELDPRITGSALQDVRGEATLTPNEQCEAQDLILNDWNTGWECVKPYEMFQLMQFSGVCHYAFNGSINDFQSMGGIFGYRAWECAVMH